MAYRLEQDKMAALGAFVRERRKALGLTQAQLGERLGYVQERVSLIENGKYGLPSLPALARIAEALEASLSEILEATGYADAMPSPAGDHESLPDTLMPEFRTRDAIREHPDGDRTSRLHYLVQESQRLVVSLEDLQGRVEETQMQLATIEELRTRLRAQRLEASELTRALIARSSNTMSRAVQRSRDGHGSTAGPE